MVGRKQRGRSRGRGNRGRGIDRGGGSRGRGGRARGGGYGGQDDAATHEKDADFAFGNLLLRTSDPSGCPEASSSV